MGCGSMQVPLLQSPASDLDWAPNGQGGDNPYLPLPLHWCKSVLLNAVMLVLRKTIRIRHMQACLALNTLVFEILATLVSTCTFEDCKVHDLFEGTIENLWVDIEKNC